MRDPKQVDFLIVGQGIAGTLLSHFLLKAGQRVLVMDKGVSGTASQVAAGIINPITGRRFVRTWRMDELLPFALQTYRDLEKELKSSLYQKRTIIRCVFSVGDENNWLSRCGDPAFKPYLSEEVDLGTYAEAVHPALTYGAIQGAAQVNLGKLCQVFRNKWIERGCLLEREFDFELLKKGERGISYQEISARQVVFCEGFQAVENPFFNYLPFKGDKGDVLIIEVPDVAFSTIIKHKTYIVPLEDGQYWVGATYIHDFKERGPTEAGRERIMERLKHTLRIPFRVLEYRAAVRPTVEDRRPLLGRHPEYEQLNIFNGLGTKGASLGPFFARQMAGFLLKGLPLDPEVDISRFP